MVSFVDSKIRDNNEANLKILATKEDIYALKEDIAKLEGRLDVKIGDVKAEMIKWMFIFWMGQVAITVGLIMVYLKK